MANTAEDRIKNDQLGKLVGNFGGDFPVITINDYTISQRELESFQINTDNWLPEISLSVSFTNGVFLARHFPKDGDLISVFIRSFNNLFKTIKCDFYITKAITTPSVDSEGNIMSMFFKGYLNIPNLYSDIDICFSNKSSIETLTEIANKLGLGFVSNETSTDDKMTWRTNKKSYVHLIQHIAKHAYKDDNSFFDIWIDYYYNLNFLNLNKNYSVPDDMQVFEGMIQGHFNVDYDGKETQFQKSKIILSNSKEAASGNQYFKSYRLVNSSGIKNSILGHKQHLYIYDNSLKELVDFETSPFKTTSSENNKIVMLGRKNEDYYQTNIKHNWLGFQYSGKNANVHSFYKLAYIQNLHNLKEVNKIGIECELPLCNFNLYKGQVLPIIFMNQNDPQRVKVSGNVDDNSKAVGASLDRFLSGNYVINNINIEWHKNTPKGSPSPGGLFSQKVMISRREWTMPNDVKHKFNSDPSSWNSDYSF